MKDNVVFGSSLLLKIGERGEWMWNNFTQSQRLIVLQTN